jgi:hypothetical protein
MFRWLLLQMDRGQPEPEARQKGGVSGGGLLRLASKVHANRSFVFGGISLSCRSQGPHEVTWLARPGEISSDPGCRS